MEEDENRTTAVVTGTANTMVAPLNAAELQDTHITMRQMPYLNSCIPTWENGENQANGFSWRLAVFLTVSLHSFKYSIVGGVNFLYDFEESQVCLPSAKRRC